MSQESLVQLYFKQLDRADLDFMLKLYERDFKNFGYDPGVADIELFDDPTKRVANSTEK